MAYESSYELLTNYGYALLEQLEGEGGEIQYDPHGEGDPESYNDIFYSGVYGGDFNPDQAQDFVVYELELPQDAAELDEEEVWALLSEELNSRFGGWVLDREKNRVYLVAEPSYL